jgi:predicted homoserine dehydrogenase-like protein
MSQLASPTSTCKVGISGTGFIARGTAAALTAAGFEVASVLTRRPPSEVSQFPQPDALTNDLDQFVSACELVVECSGDAVHATDVVDAAMQNGRPVVTMNCEFQVTSGSAFVECGLLTEAEGDQPGCLAMLRREIVSMGFEPLVYGNVKGFLNRTPEPDEMKYWSGRQGISTAQTTSFTDGTKLQIEQTLVANSFGAGIAQPGLLGPENGDLMAGGRILAAEAQKLGRPISDYVLCPGIPGVFITATHEEFQKPFLSYLKLGDGPFYTLIKGYHLCHLEIPRTVRGVVESNDILMNNSASPEISVNTIAKRDLAEGHLVEQGIGSFDVRGEAIEIAADPDHVPIGLMKNARLTRSVEAGEPLTLADVELPDSLAIRLWKDIVAKATA